MRSAAMLFFCLPELIVWLAFVVVASTLSCTDPRYPYSRNNLPTICVSSQSFSSSASVPCEHWCTVDPSHDDGCSGCCGDISAKMCRRASCIDPRFPHPSAFDPTICVSSQSFAKLSAGVPCEHWCTVDPSHGDGCNGCCGDISAKMCRRASCIDPLFPFTSVSDPRSCVSSHALASGGAGVPCKDWCTIHPSQNYDGCGGCCGDISAKVCQARLYLDSYSELGDTACYSPSGHHWQRYYVSGSVDDCKSTCNNQIFCIGLAHGPAGCNLHTTQEIADGSAPSAVHTGQAGWPTSPEDLFLDTSPTPVAGFKCFRRDEASLDASYRVHAVGCSCGDSTWEARYPDGRANWNTKQWADCLARCQVESSPANGAACKYFSHAPEGDCVLAAECSTCNSGTHTTYELLVPQSLFRIEKAGCFCKDNMWEARYPDGTANWNTKQWADCLARCQMETSPADGAACKYFSHTPVGDCMLAAGCDTCQASVDYTSYELLVPQSVYLIEKANCRCKDNTWEAHYPDGVANWNTKQWADCLARCKVEASPADGAACKYFSHSPVGDCVLAAGCDTCQASVDYTSYELLSSLSISSPSASPTAGPTQSPTAAPTPSLSVGTSSPTVVPTQSPTSLTPTATPTAPAATPTPLPPDSTYVTEAPSSAPSVAPTPWPTQTPTVTPGTSATAAPTADPTAAPADKPTADPTVAPTGQPTPLPGATVGFAMVIYNLDYALLNDETRASLSVEIRTLISIQGHVSEDAVKVRLLAGSVIVNASVATPRGVSHQVFRKRLVESTLPIGLADILKRTSGINGAVNGEIEISEVFFWDLEFSEDEPAVTAGTETQWIMPTFIASSATLVSVAFACILWKIRSCLGAFFKRRSSVKTNPVRSVAWYRGYLDKHETFINNLATKASFGGELRVLGVEGDVKYGTTTKLEWTALQEDLDEFYSQGAISFRPQCVRVPLAHVREELGWVAKKPGRHILMSSCPVRVGDNFEVMAEVERLCSEYDNVTILFSRASQLSFADKSQRDVEAARHVSKQKEKDKQRMAECSAPSIVML